ncbi:MAG: class I SAM-dependent methyltransferase [Candidatus Methanoperedens sp.]|nr:class I SAM-dependent methyltransferase [Candidatus Methanoperedens sp.]
MQQECIFCNGNSVSIIKPAGSGDTPENRCFLKCGVCDLVFVPEQFHLSPDDEIARYRLHDNSLSNEGYVWLFKEKIALVRYYCTDVNSALDYGCGPEPVLAELLRREGFNCDVFDPHFFPEFPGGKFDLVISTEVFEHFRKIKPELERIRAYLNPGGFLAVMTGFHDAVDCFEKWWYITDPTHICFFSMRTFGWIAERLGFRIIYTNMKNFVIMQLL